MGWLRNLFGGARRPAASRPFFRPRLEALEERLTPNVSSVIDSAGNRTTFVVDVGNNLMRYDSTGGHLLVDASAGSPVLRVHGYRDFNGGTGVIVIYSSEAAYDYGTTVVQSLGTGIADCDKAYDKAGHIQEYVTHDNGAGGFLTVLYTDTSVSLVDQGSNFALLIHPFQDAQGNIGLEVAYVTGANTTVLVEFDSTGIRFLANDAVSDKTTAGPNGPPGQFIQDVTYVNNNAFQYTESYAIFQGDIYPA
jgi:hypothetical protein